MRLSANRRAVRPRQLCARPATRRRPATHPHRPTARRSAPRQRPRPAITRSRTFQATAARGAERELILRMLQRTRWNRKETAGILGISYKALLYKIKENGLDKAS